MFALEWGVAVLFGCAKHLPLIPESEFVRLKPSEMAVQADKHRVRPPLPKSEIARIVLLMQRRGTNPVYRGYLWQLIERATTPNFARENRDLWFINKDEIDATKEIRHTGSDEGRIDISFWRKLEKQTGLRIAVLPIGSLHDGSKRGKGVRLTNAPTFTYITGVCAFSGVGTDFVFGYGTLLICGNDGDHAQIYSADGHRHWAAGAINPQIAYEHYLKCEIPGRSMQIREQYDRSGLQR